MNTIVKGSFIGRDGHSWDVELRRTTDPDSELVTERLEPLDIAADAITIEWADTARHEAVCGSCCTISVQSGGYADWREYLTAEPCEVSLTLRRDGALYWMGALDTETYLEPYDADNHYDVELTFYDFGSLDRLRFDLPAEGRYSITELIAEGLRAAGIYDTLVQTHALQVSAAGAEAMTCNLSHITVRGADFYDEDGEAMTWREVLANVLEPLSLRLVQGAGVFVIYSISRLSPSANPRLIRWSATGQTLGVDDMYNAVELEYSPYADTTPVDTKMNFDDLDDGTQFASFRADKLLTSAEAFRLLHTTTPVADLPMLLPDEGDAVPVKQKAIYGSSDDAYLLVVWPHGRYDHTPVPCPAADNGIAGGLLFASRSFVLDKLPELLCVKLEMLLDGRYNPFEPAGENNNESVYKEQREYIAAAVYAQIKLTADDGTVYTWHNNLLNDGAKPQWKQEPGGFCLLTYYSWKQGGGDVIGGWITNRHSEGLPSKVLRGTNSSQGFLDFCQRRGDGEFISAPPVPGVVEVKIFGPVLAYDKKGHLASGDGKGNYSAFTWLAFRSLTVGICDRYGKTVDAEDLRYRVDIDERLANTLSLTSNCGSPDGVPASARSIYFYDGNTDFTVGHDGHMGNAERTRIAMVASQYAGRTHVLSGETYADDRWRNPFAMHYPMADPALPGVVFMLTAATYNVLDGTATITAKQVKPVTYDVDTDVTTE